MRIIKIIIFILITIGLLWLAILLLTNVFSSNRSSQVTKQQETRQKLSAFANTDAVVEMKIDGPIVSNEEHRALKISVSRSQSQVQMISGYQDNAIKQETVANNQASFEEFLKALEQTGFYLPTLTEVKIDEAGVCPTGNRYVYSVTEGGKEVHRAWTTNCGEGGGNFAGSHRSTKQLFVNQIPKNQLNAVTRGERLAI